MSRVLSSLVTHLVPGLPGQEDEVRHGAHEDEHAVKGERDEEEIKISIVPLSNTITHPRAMVIEFGDTTITKRTMFRPRNIKYQGL